MDRKKRRLAPVHGFGINTGLGVVPLVLEDLTYVCCVESTLALVTYDDDGMKPMQFFPAPETQRSVTALTAHSRRRLLAVCCTSTEESTFLIYTLGQYNDTWVPAILASHDLPGNDKYRSVAFCSKDSVVVCVSSSRIVGVDWNNGVRYLTEFQGDVTRTVYHPRDPLEVATAGRGHLQLWRFLNKQLKPRPPIIGIDDMSSSEYSALAWLESTEVVLAGTTTGDVVILQQNALLQRFDQVHHGEVRSICEDANAVVTLGARGVACVYRQNYFDVAGSSTSTPVLPPQRVDITLARRVSLVDGIAGRLVSAAQFPSSRGHYLICGSEGASIVDLAALVLDVNTEAPAGIFRSLGASHHLDAETGAISAISAAIRRPLIASCSPTNKLIYVWDWRSRNVFSKLVGAGEALLEDKVLKCVALHPSGDELLAGFEDLVVLYHVARENLLFQQAISNIKGVVKLKHDTTPIVTTAPLSLVKYTSTGRGFAAVVGRLVEIYGSTQSGETELFQCLFGHAGEIVDIAFSFDDLRLWSISNDGAIYEWTTFRGEHYGQAVSRSREYVNIDMTWSFVDRFFDGTLVVAGTVLREKTTGPDGLVSVTELTTPRAVLCCWTTKTSLDMEPTVVTMKTSENITALLAVDATTEFEGALVIGTSSGSVLVYNSSFSDDPDDVPLCDGQVTALSYSENGNRLCAASDRGAIVVCDLGGGWRSSRRTSRVVTARAQVAEKLESKLDYFIREGPQNTGGQETVVVSKAALDALEAKCQNLVSAMDQMQLEAQKNIDGVAPKLRKDLDRCKKELKEQRMKTEIDSAKKDDEIRLTLETHARQLAELKEKFQTEFQNLEDQYDRKLAIEAARYIEMREERDNVTREARQRLEEHHEEAVKAKTELQVEAETKVAESQKKVELLKEYVEHAQRQFTVVLEQHDEKSAEDLEKAKHDTEAAHEGAQKARQNLILETASLKQKCMALEMASHKSRDDLVDARSALQDEQKRNEALKLELKELQLRCDEETKRGDDFQATATKQREKLTELEAMKTSIDDRKQKLAATLQDKDDQIRAASKKWHRLDQLLEDAGHKQKDLEAKLLSKSSAFKRSNDLLFQTRAHAENKNKRVKHLIDIFDVFLDNLRDPSFRRNDIVFRELSALRNGLSTIYDRHLSATQSDPNLTKKKPLLLRGGGGLRPVLTQKEDPYSKQNQAVKKLRGQNLSLMDELNGLRFDRLSLRRKLQDAHFQLKWSPPPPEGEET